MTADAGPEPIDRDAILSALDQPIPPVKATLLYRCGLLVVSVGMLLLPLLYIALIATLGYLLYWHATANLDLLDGGSAIKSRGILYVGPLIAGAVAIFFLLKPFLARHKHQRDTMQITREDQPFLYEFVERLCRCVGAPAPREIHIDNRVNASASLRNGLRSVVSRDLVLTIGAPLAAGMSLRQFTGVLAHEFGHFAQGAGMGLQYIIRTINHWFARVVYERDSWDEKLHSWSGKVEGWLAAILRLAQGLVWTSRRVLWALMWCGKAMSGFLAQEMEFDADRYEARVSGSDTFETTARQLIILGYAASWAESDQRDFWQEDQLCANYSALTLAQIPEMEARDGMIADITEGLNERKTSWVSTHPADGLRIDNAQREQTTGVFQIDGATAQVFDDFDGLCQRVTQHVYAVEWGIELAAERWLSIDQALGRSAERTASRDSVIEYLSGWHPRNVLRPFLPETPVAPADDLAGATATLRSTHQTWHETVQSFGPGLKEFREITEKRNQLYVAAVLMDAGCKVDAKQLGIDAQELKKDRFLAKAQEEWESARDSREELTLAAEARLHAGLVVACTAQPENAPRIQTLSAVFAALGSVFSDLSNLAFRDSGLRALLPSYVEKKSDDVYSDEVAGLIHSIREHLWSVCNRLGDVPYPYEHPQGELSLQDFLVPSIPKEEEAEPHHYLTLAKDAFERGDTLYTRLLGDLAKFAGEVEAQQPARST